MSCSIQVAEPERAPHGPPLGVSAAACRPGSQAQKNLFTPDESKPSTSTPQPSYEQGMQLALSTEPEPSNDLYHYFAQTSRRIHDEGGSCQHGPHLVLDMQGPQSTSGCGLPVRL